MEEIIISIPHTGTRFLSKRLGIERHLHVTTGWSGLIRETEGKKLVAPLRDPKDVWKSHVRRWVPWDAPDNLPRFWSGWYHMHALTLVRDIEFIPVDLKLSDRITDWTPVTGDEREQALSNEKCPNLSLRWLYTLPFVAKYYKDK